MQPRETVAATEHILALRNYPRKPAYLTAALEDLFNHFGQIPDASKAVLSDYFHIGQWPDDLINSLFHAAPAHTEKVKVCEGPFCREAGGDRLAETLKRELHHSIERHHCMGSCQRAPAAMIGDEVIAHATPAKIRELLA